MEFVISRKWSMDGFLCGASVAVLSFDRRLVCQVGLGLQKQVVVQTMGQQTFFKLGCEDTGGTHGSRVQYYSSKGTEDRHDVDQQTRGYQQECQAPNPKGQQQKEVEKKTEKKGIDATDDTPSGQFCCVLPNTGTKDAVGIDGIDCVHHRPSRKGGNQRQNRQNRTEQDHHTSPKSQGVMVSLQQRHSDLRRHVCRIEQDTEFGAQEERQKDHVTSVALGHVASQVLAIVFGPGQVAAPQTKVVDGDQVFPDLDQFQQRIPRRMRIIPTTILAGSSLFQRKRLGGISPSGGGGVAGWQQGRRGFQDSHGRCDRTILVL